MAISAGIPLSYNSAYDESVCCMDGNYNGLHRRGNHRSILSPGELAGGI